ncbi:MAG TPA: COX15/CtaA family protein [Alphaproteobacteria bacterium]|nr:COX15/CtaA family protein [Alphaproteobacteria bacterium]
MSLRPFSSTPSARPVALWLFICAGLILLMTLVGAVTRLTGSGLSIVVWQPLTGALPPLSAQAWNDMFALYKQSPEFLKKNSWMELADFKAIFFWEWFHRLLGRLIGLAYAVPLLWFWVRGHIPARYKPALLGLLALGGAQGAMGWYMVSSGLVDHPEVSHFRLAAHLGLAVALYALMIWTGRGLWGPVRPLPDRAHLRIHAWVCLYAVLITMIWGAFTAGLDAGLVYNTFPAMGEGLIPPEVAALHPAWTNAFQNPVTVQFAHRWLGIGTFLILAFYGVRLMRRKETRDAGVLVGAASLQVGLGIATLVSGVPVLLATAHQGGALVLLTVLLLHLRRAESAEESHI